MGLKKDLEDVSNFIFNISEMLNFCAVKTSFSREFK